MSLKYKIDIDWKQIERGRPYQPQTSTKSIANDLADMFTTAATTLAEEVTQDFADDNTRLIFTLTIKPPAPKLEYYSTFTVKSVQQLDEDKKLELNKEILQAIATAQEQVAMRLELDISLTNKKSGESNIQFRNITATQRARFDVELHKLIPSILSEVCQSLGYECEFNKNKIAPQRITPFNYPPSIKPY